MLMLIDPSIKNEITGALMVFGIAIGGAVIVVLIHLWILRRNQQVLDN